MLTQGQQRCWPFLCSYFISSPFIFSLNTYILKIINNYRIKKLTLSSLLLTALTLTVSAQTGSQVSAGISSLAGLIDTITNTVVKSAATLLLSLALLAFFYGIVEYIWAKRQGDAKGVSAGNKFMTWGLVALFVMFSVYGIIKFAQNILGMPNVTTIEIPNINFKAGTSGSATGGNANPYSPGSATGGGTYTNPTGGSATGGNTYTNPTGGGSSSGSNTRTVSSCTTGYVSNGKCYDDGYCLNGCPMTTGGGSTTGGNSSGSGTAGYKCSPGYECTRADGSGSIGICNSAGDFCDPAGDSNAATYQCPDGSMVAPSDAKFCPAAPADYGCGPGNGYPDEFGSCN